MKEFTKKTVQVNYLNLNAYDLDGMTLVELNALFKTETKAVAKNAKVAMKDLTVVFAYEQYYEDVDLGLRFSRMETDAEFEKRKAKSIAASERATKAAAKRKANQLQKIATKLAASETKEKELLEFLKDKYESA